MLPRIREDHRHSSHFHGGEKHAAPILKIVIGNRTFTPVPTLVLASQGNAAVVEMIARWLSAGTAVVRAATLMLFLLAIQDSSLR
ncbi:hypothetical protein M8312_09480 [Sphingomonas sp. KRR8]|uniref:hypothetical protein n=1 Tax=Sphingomonas sp. KRR8 TaxID=2942996 RepID=UPI002021933B|nr:hypothetical protein [Sphingomonas sp. KRR8]URD60030.1 hypothetical protein M8312_09480 [Sphingomonas sp. KRR8]